MPFSVAAAVPIELAAPVTAVGSSLRRPIRLPAYSVNQMFPSGPVVIPSGWLPAVIPFEYSVTTPAGVMRPILPASSVNQRLPSGPTVIPNGRLLAVIPFENSVTTPVGVMRPILSVVVSVNQRFPSGPATMPFGLGAGRDPGREPVHHPVHRDPPDRGGLLGEPEVPVRPGRDRGGQAAGPEHPGHLPGGADPADCGFLGEPEIPVRSSGDPAGALLAFREFENSVAFSSPA